jgi:hypothetical protein
MKRAAWLSVLLAGASLLGGAPAAASQAVSIDVGRIAVRDQLAPGGEYRLPTFGVRNPGTESTSYGIDVSYVDDQSTLRPPATWFRFDPGTLTLASGESAAISTLLQIPADAEPGDYGALIGPRIAGGTAGARIGASAVARVTFTVEPSSALDAWFRAILRVLLANPWLLALAAMIGTVGAGLLVKRRFAITIRKR